MASAIDREIASDSLHWTCLTSIWLDSGGGAAALLSNSVISASVVIAADREAVVELLGKEFLRAVGIEKIEERIAKVGFVGR
jgi:hypothetical protein